MKCKSGDGPYLPTVKSCLCYHTRCQDCEIYRLFEKKEVKKSSTTLPDSAAELEGLAQGGGSWWRKIFRRQRVDQGRSIIEAEEGRK